jgi:male germ cell-associated kinase
MVEVSNLPLAEVEEVVMEGEVSDCFINNDLVENDVVARSYRFDIRWMATGSTACTVDNAANMCIGDVKAAVQDQTGVPICEQRLFAGLQELFPDASPIASIGEEVLLVRSVSDPNATDLSHLHPPSTEFSPVMKGQFSVVRRLATGINGDVYRYTWRQGNVMETVAVKKLRRSCIDRPANQERNERTLHFDSRTHATSGEDALTEIGVLTYLAQQQDLPLYLLRMRGVFMENSFVWLISELAEGGELFEVAASRRVEETEIRSYMWQILQAIAYLHKHCIGHRDVSLENTLLKNGKVRVMDFGMAVSSQSSSGTVKRYYRAVGKDNYRAPECYVPSCVHSSLVAPANARPFEVVFSELTSGHLSEVRLPEDVTPNKLCKAETWGYAATPADVFSTGMCLFILGFQCPAWGNARLSDPYFKFVFTNGHTGIEKLLQSWRKRLLSQEAMNLMTKMLSPDPSERPTAHQCLAHPWFGVLANTPVERHDAN